VLWWIRRDLRLTDNLALAAAQHTGRDIVPVFVLDPKLLRDPATLRQRFLMAGLRELDAELRARGSRLVVRRGDPLHALGGLRSETGAGAIFAESDVTPFARARDAAVAAELPLEPHGSPAVHPPDLVVKPNGDPYVVYSAFRERWLEIAPPARGDLAAAPHDLPPVADDVASAPLPADDSPASFAPGEVEAARRLARFTDPEHGGIWRYAALRDRLDMDGTSALSPYLRFGMLSAREAAAAAREAAGAAYGPSAREGAAKWLDELIWREFYIGVLRHFPAVAHREFRPEFRAVAWRDDDAGFEAWMEGRTGYPVVDAAMRQLRDTGWIPNRARMIAASFLTRDLLVDWRRGERWFMDQLVDGDPASNNGGWQWTAGVGTDAAPIFRIFNPVLQGRKHDPAGAYVRRWVPEIAHVPDEFVHEPWKMGESIQRRAGCLIGRDYPQPIVDHETARRRALHAFRNARLG
jgi:deoxyribodipyrimidine photo-lyase